MKVSQKNIILASRLNQRAMEFFTAAESMRIHFSGAVHVIDYCTALSFELRLKSIFAARGVFADGEVDKKHHHHDICKFFNECEITFDNEKHNELIAYYNVILNGIGRYSTTTDGDREKLNSVLLGAYNKIDNYFKTQDKNCVYDINPESGINDDSYEEIWKILNEIFCTEYAAAQKILTS